MKRFYLYLIILLFCLLISLFTNCEFQKAIEEEIFGDENAPTITSVYPTINEKDVPTNISITVNFNEEIDPKTINSSTFYLLDPEGESVAGYVNYMRKVASFSPDSDLLSNSKYTAVITTGVKDKAGNALPTDFMWKFTTGTGSDNTPPVVISTNPVNGATGVAVNTTVNVTFSENIDTSTITNQTFTLSTGGNNISGSVSSAGSTATFTPSANLNYNTTYIGKITKDVKDLAGNKLGSDYSWSFTTGSAPDTDPPRVISTYPANGATGVNVNVEITATFSEAMKASTINTATFIVGGVSGTVTYNNTNNTATFKPASNLAYNTQYSVTLTTDVEDLAGNKLSSNYQWTFKTMAAQSGAVYVSTSGSPSNSGLEPSLPKSTIADGIAVAQANGIKEVRVAEGTYNESVTMVRDVSLKGGYSRDFTTQDFNSYISKITGAAGTISIIDATDPTITNDVVIEGFTLESSSHYIGLALDGGGSPTIKNNKIKLSRDILDTNCLYAIHTVSNCGNFKFIGNEVWLYRINCTDTVRSARAILIRSHSGSGLTISKNKIFAYGNTYTRGIDLDYQQGEVVITNNIISVYGGSYTWGIYFANTHNKTIITNNTIISNRAYGSYFGMNSPSSGTVIAVNNIFGTPTRAGTGVSGSSYLTTFSYNLVFNFSTSCSGFTPDSTNKLEITDIFSELFVSAYDSDFSDGHSTDYHLTDYGVFYAVDKGTDTSSSSYGSVIEDIDSQTRPRGSAYDRGADEK